MQTNLSMRKARAAINVIFFINGFLFANYIARIPDIQSHFDLDYQQVGFVLLSSAIASLVAMPFTGGLIARYGSRVVCILAVVTYSLSVAFFMLAPNFGALLFVFFIIGASAGILDVSMNAQAIIVERALAKPIMASFHGAFSLGMFVGSMTAGLFIGLKHPLIVHMICMAIGSWMLLFYFYRFLVQDRPKQGQPASSKLFNLPTRPLIIIGIIAFCGMLGEGAMAEWSTNYMREVIHASDLLSPIGLSAFSLAMLAGRLVGDRARHIYGDRFLVIVCSILAIIGLVIVLTILHPVASIIGFLCIGVGLSVIVPITYSQAGNIKGIDPGTGISMVTTIGYAGFIIGPPVLGFLADWQGLRVAYCFVLFLFLMMLLLSYRRRSPV